MSTDKNSPEHPAGLLEGLRQSAAGEIVYLGSFEQYADDALCGFSIGEEVQTYAEKLSPVSLATEAHAHIQLSIEDAG